MAKIIDIKTRQVLADLPTDMPSSRRVALYRVINTGIDGKLSIIATSTQACIWITHIMQSTQPNGLYSPWY